MTKPTYLALDIGAVRIGVAIGSIMPFGRGALPAKEPELVLAHLRDIIRDEGIDGIVVGLPHVKSGDHTESYSLAQSWIERIKGAFADLPLYTVDEAYSSVEAEHQLVEEGIDIRHNKAKVDERAAELLLAQFLNQS